MDRSIVGPRIRTPAGDQKLGRARPRPAVGVFQTNDVVQLGSAHLENVAVGQGDHPMFHHRTDMKSIARLHLLLFEPSSFIDDKKQATRLEVDRLVLAVMVLQRELVALAYVQELFDISVGASPDDLVAPRFFHSLSACHWITCFSSPRLQMPGAASLGENLPDTSPPPPWMRTHPCAHDTSGRGPSHLIRRHRADSLWPGASPQTARRLRAPDSRTTEA